MKDRHLEQAVKYSRALEEQSKASTREKELLRQVSPLGGLLNSLSFVLFVWLERVWTSFTF